MNVMSTLEALRGLYSKPTSLFSLAYLKTLLASCRVVVVALVTLPASMLTAACSQGAVWVLGHCKAPSRARSAVFSPLVTGNGD